MKKFLLILCLACFSVSACANEVFAAKRNYNNQEGNTKTTTVQNVYKNMTANNSLQQAYEEKFKEQLQQQIAIEFLFSGNYILKDDYNGYLNGGKSLYGEIINKITQLKNSNTPNKDLSLKYLTQLKYNIENATRNNANTTLMVIPDNDFKMLDDETKLFINLNNICAQDDKTIYLEPIIQGFNAQIDKWQATFDKNKNNPKVLKELYNEVKTTENTIKKYLDLKYASQVRIANKLNEFYNALNSTSYIIYKQGESYEKQKFLTWAQKNHKKLIDGRLSNYVYYAQAPTPKIGYLYEHIPTGDFYLKVLQSVPGGVILTGEYMGPYGPTGYGSIFLQTSKQFADGQIIREGIVAEYKGYYDYYTVLGVKKRIYKFYRLGETEIKKNFEIPGQPFYFYLSY